MRRHITILGLSAIAGSAQAAILSDPVRTDPFHGALQTSIAIDVPAFHEIEPQLALSYSSTGGNGFAGVGWDLAGVGVIERVSPGRGAPRYDASDIFALDGQELIACAAGSSSPSCTTCPAGHACYSTRVESYVRIGFSAADNRWTVWRKDGVRTLFEPVYVVSAGTFRWGQTAVIDTRDHRVDYRWECDPAADCYPSEIVYDAYRVRLFRELRPDAIDFANGEYIGQMRQRLKSVLVQLDLVGPIRAYGLDYAVSAGTDRSLLTSVQEYGKDVVVDGAGAITAGTALPAQTFTYSSDPAGKTFVAPTPTASPFTVEAVTWFKAVNADATTPTLRKATASTDWDAGGSSTRAILSGDGYVEFAVAYWTSSLMAGLSSDDSSVYYSDIDFAIFLGYDSATDARGVYVFEGGVLKGDFGTWSPYTDRFRVVVANGVVSYQRTSGGAWTTFHTSTQAPTYPLRLDASLANVNSALTGTIAGALVDVAPWCATGNRMSGDYNGDGKIDELCRTTTRQEVRLGNGAGFDAPASWGELAVCDQDFHGDFNNDGKQDLGCYGSWGGDFRVALSSGAGFGPWQDWLVGYDWCRIDPVQIGTADFNGDGATDVYCHRIDRFGCTSDNCNAGTKHVGLSSGSGFAMSNWGTMYCDWHEQWSDAVGTGDFNGDGKDDFWCVSGHDATYHPGAVFLSTGTGIAGSFGWSNGGLCGGDADRTLFGDVNADGKTDVVCPASGALALSTGRSMAVKTGTPWACPTAATNMALADVDGNGSTDLVCNNTGAPANDIEVRRFANGALTAPETWLGGWCPGRVDVGDNDADGKTDLLCDDSHRLVATAGTPRVVADLVTAATSSLGGSYAIEYLPSTTWPSTNNPPPAQTISAITVNDGRGGSARTTYSYSGGAMDRKERRFYGFGYVMATLPCNEGETVCPYVATHFKHDTGLPARPWRVNRRDGNHALLAREEIEYEIQNTTPPFVSQPSGRWSYSYGPGGYKRRYESYTYDGYGNPLRVYRYGDYDVTGDETTTESYYAPHAYDYIVGLVGAANRWAGIGTTGTFLGQDLFHYDGATAWTTPPTRGELTASLRWDSTTGGFVQRTTAYDDQGNVASETDETGRTTTYAYDPTYRLFPTAVANPAGESESFVWDPRCQKPVQHTDASGQVTSFQVDALCRPSRTDEPLGSFTIYSYVSMGDPQAQYVRVDRPVPVRARVGKLYEREYVDGLGRTYRRVRRGSTPGNDIEERTSYTPRGKVASTSAPYYPAQGALPRYTTFTYDALDRTISTTAPDGSAVVSSYDAWSRTDADPHGHPTRTRFDAAGRTLATEQTHGSTTLTTTYRYSSAGHLIEITDPAANAWTRSWDSLGRMRSESDPDAGTKTYEHDHAGRLVASTDARGVRTELAYDDAGRLARRSFGDEPETTFGYSQQRDGYSNTGRLTTMSDGAGTVELDHDALGRVVEERRTVDGVVYRLATRYDAGGRLTGYTFPDDDTVDMRYDASGRLSSIPGIARAITYDASGAPLEQHSTNGTTTTWTRSPMRGWLERIRTVVASSGEVVQDLSYERDQAGVMRQVSSAVASESWTYDYDDLDRLIVADNLTPGLGQSFTYDAIGNITYNSKVGAYSYPPAGAPRPHAPVDIAGSPQVYDPAGQLLSGMGRSLDWNAAGLPSRVNGTTFDYDGDLARIQKHDAGGTTLYLFGGLYEVSPSGQATKYIEHGGRLIAKRVGSETRWIHTDLLESVHRVTNSAGEVVLERSYAPYGEPIVDDGSEDDSRGYIGEAYDDDTGLSYLNARYYDPVTALFLSPDASDPTGAGVGLHRYAYAAGDPIVRRDPSGETWCIEITTTITTNNSVTVDVMTRCYPGYGGPSYWGTCYMRPELPWCGPSHNPSTPSGCPAGQSLGPQGCYTLPSQDPPTVPPNVPPTVPPPVPPSTNDKPKRPKHKFEGELKPQRPSDIERNRRLDAAEMKARLELQRKIDARCQFANAAIVGIGAYAAKKIPHGGKLVTTALAWAGISKKEVVTEALLDAAHAAENFARNMFSLGPSPCQ
jgi:RHS repeat-associated protein